MFPAAPLRGAIVTLCGLFLGVSVLFGCAQQPPKDTGDASLDADVEVEEDEDRPAPPRLASPEVPSDLPANELTQGLLYEFLLAEIAGQRGNVGVAAQTYTELARRTRDPRVARRATEIAIFARMTATAAEAARIWRETD